MIVLPCGERSIRFRPALSVSEDEIDEAVAALVGRAARRAWTPRVHMLEGRITSAMAASTQHFDAHLRAPCRACQTLAAGYARAQTLTSSRTGGGCSRRRRPAGTSTSWPGSCSSRGAASTRSARPGTRATPLVAMAAAADRPGAAALPLRRRSTVARADQVPGSTPVRDVLQGLMALADEPIAGGRHKVFGHPDLAIIPQTSTIASHLPRAVGLALALHRAHRLGVDCEWPADAVVVCSLRRCLGQPLDRGRCDQHRPERRLPGLPVPILFVCEDNGWGISVPTPAGLDRAPRTAPGPGWSYVAVDGADPAAARHRDRPRPCDRVRDARRPVFLHLRTVRFLGHAGSDAEIAYRQPRRHRGRLRPRSRCWPPPGLLTGAGVEPAEIARPLRRRSGPRSMPRPSGCADAPQLRLGAPRSWPRSRPRRPAPGRRRGAATTAPREPAEGPRRATLAESINAHARPILAATRRVIVFGEDVGAKGGVYGVTGGLARRHGAARVFDTVLDEQSILGLALGAGLAGLIPIPEIQYLAYLHNAEDQLRGEARHPAVLLPRPVPQPDGRPGGRAGLPEGVRRSLPQRQRGRCAARHPRPGRRLPGPRRRRRRAAPHLRGRRRDRRTLSVFLEPIALYHRRDLHADGDGGWLAVRSRSSTSRSARARVYGPTAQGSQHHLTMITFGNGVPMSLRVARRLADDGIAADVLDLRWLAPLPIADVLAAARRTGRVLVVDETRHDRRRRRGRDHRAGRGRVRRADRAGSPARTASSPSGPAASTCCSSEDEIEKAAMHAGRDGDDMTGTGPLELLGVDHLLSDDERDIQASVREFVDRRVRPHIADWFERGELDLDLMREAGVARPAGHAPGGLRLRGHQRRRRTGWPAWSWRPATPACAAWCRCRARWPCSRSGSSAARSRSTTWLPRMAAGEAIGCFGLTEPDFGSNPAGMRTRAKRDGDDWVLNGTKMWITNGSVADVAVVWAQTDDGHPRLRGADRTPGLLRAQDHAQAVAARLDHLRAGPGRRTAARPTRCCPRLTGCAGRCPA